MPSSSTSRSANRGWWVAAMLSATSLTLPSLPAASVGDRAVERATWLLQAFVARDYETYRRAASPQLLKALPPEQLAAVFADLARQGGAFVRLGPASVQSRNGNSMVEMPLEYERATQTVGVMLDAKGALTGLQIRPAGNLSAYRPAPYVDATRFTEKDVVVDAGGWPLPGTLTVPNGDAPFPAVVLVHGSGPNDRDSSIGPNRMFRDLAEGLATRGVAVLRYEKRSREHAARLSEVADLTPKEEVIDDALAALALLRQQPFVAADRLFIAGHSFGGTLAPAIAAADPSLSGVVILAGATRPMEDTIVFQTRYLAQLDGEVSSTEAEQIARYESFAGRVKALKRATDRPPAGGPASAPTSYWLALRSLDPAKTGAALRVPALVLQGERDYQVTMEDFGNWRAILATHPAAKFQSFPRLNHAFMPGEGPSSPAEYSVPNHVDAAVVDSIAAWINGSD